VYWRKIPIYAIHSVSVMGQHKTIRSPETRLQVINFLAYAKHWKGPVAYRIKKELGEMLQCQYS
jgi:hypothetical protein